MNERWANSALKTVSFYIEEEVIEALKLKAKHEERSLSVTLNRILRHELIMKPLIMPKHMIT